MKIMSEGMGTFIILALPWVYFFLVLVTLSRGMYGTFALISAATLLLGWVASEFSEESRGPISGY